jgi:hypothetical protein
MNAFTFVNMLKRRFTALGDAKAPILGEKWRYFALGLVGCISAYFPVFGIAESVC